jgi:hypothetical protein
MPRFKLRIALVKNLSFSNKKKERLGKTLTNISEATRYNPRVAASEITIFLKIWLVKREPTSSPPEETRPSMPLIASKNAEA